MEKRVSGRRALRAHNEAVCNGKPGDDKAHSEAQATPQPMVKHIELWPIDKLIPLVRNPRTHSDTQIAQIAASIREFGFNNPILVDTKAGIIAGHGRLFAARKLGLAEVPVIVLDHLSEAQKRAYIIADNQLALNAGWDDEILRAELALLQAEEFNLDLIGFEDRDLAQLLADQDSEDLANIVPDVPPVPITVFGDLWLLGKHRVLCGDSTDGPSVARLLAGAEPFLMVTDPPYGIELDSEWRDRAGLNGCRPAETSYMKRGPPGIPRHPFRATRAPTGPTPLRWFPVSKLLTFGTHRDSPARSSTACCGSDSCTTSRSSGTKAGRCSPARIIGSSTSPVVRPEEERSVVRQSRRELNHLGVAFAQVHHGRLG